MNQNNPLDTVGYFLNYRHHWLEALKLLKHQLETKEKNKHFNTLEMFYYEKIEESFEELESEGYFETRIAYNGPQYSGQELSKKYRLTDPRKWSIEHVNQKDSAHCEIQVSNCR